jgi:DNA-binding GntR family transcriptional regulator
VDLTDVRDVYEMRRLLEPYAVELAATRAPRESLEVLHRLAHAQADPADRTSYEQYLVDNREFHVQIADATGNRRLAQTLRGLLEDMQRLLFLSIESRPGRSHHEHHHLYEAILAGDAERARKLSIDQIEESHQRVIEALVRRSREGGSSRPGG